MPKLKNKFVVFRNDSEIFVYIPEDDDKFLGDTADLYNTLAEAKAVALANLKKNYEDEVKVIKAFKYGDFK